MVVNINDVRAKVTQNIKDNKQNIWQLIQQKKYEEAVNAIAGLANFLWSYNQCYVDFELEHYVSLIREGYLGKDLENPYDAKKTVIFCDGFGVDTRGLAQIYLRALAKTGYRIVYVTNETSRGVIPTLLGELSNCEHHVYYLPTDTHMNKLSTLCQIIRTEKPSKAFLYIFPHDAEIIMAFEHFANCMERYQINLTDHAFWMGVNAFDYCIEFRDYGAAISENYRYIPKEKLIKLPFYPVANEQYEFEGYPFEKKDGDFVIFSGGAFYKTFDENNTYYKMVEEIVKRYPQVKFWYAGHGDRTELDKLIAKYPTQVFFTDERKDLMQVLRHSDLYLQTYPIIGGLMTQFAAMAGVIPLGVKVDRVMHTGFTLNDDVKLFYDKPQDLLYAIKNYISDSENRKQNGKRLIEDIISIDKFNKNLVQIICSNSSEYLIKNFENVSVDVDKLHLIYMKEFIRKNVKVNQK